MIKISLAILASIVLLLVAGVLWIRYSGNTAHDRRWITSQHTFEGFPLFLRRTEPIPSASERANYSTLAVVTHTFSQRLPDGRPESAYNETLIDFDCDLVEQPLAKAVGVPVVVETYAGKRQYYFYIASPEDVAVFDEIRERYPEHELAIEHRQDPEWTFLKRYAKDYFPEVTIP